MATFWRYVRIQLFVFVCGIVGPIFLILYFAVEPNTDMKWAYWAGLFITAADVLIALGITSSSNKALVVGKRRQSGGGGGDQGSSSTSSYDPFWSNNAAFTSTDSGSSWTDSGSSSGDYSSGDSGSSSSDSGSSSSSSD